MRLLDLIDAVEDGMTSAMDELTGEDEDVGR